MAKEIRACMDKAMAMLDWVNEQIKLIDGSSQYWHEMLDQQNGEIKKSPFVEKYSTKMDERNRCVALIKEAKEELSNVESHWAKLQMANNEENG